MDGSKLPEVTPLPAHGLEWNGKDNKRCMSNRLLLHTASKLAACNTKRWGGVSPRDFQSVRSVDFDVIQINNTRTHGNTRTHDI